MMTMKIRSYTELIHLTTFEERYEYLRLNGSVGAETFGFNRYLNQWFYKSKRWKQARRDVIVRDNGLDLGVEGYEIHDRIYVHHMNPILLEDIEMERSSLFDPEFLISMSHNTHEAVHYSDASLLRVLPIERFPDDTSPWKQDRKEP